jgi:translocation and assembly module TamB
MARMASEGVLRLETLDISTRALSLQGSGTIAADGMPEKLDLTLQMGLAENGPLLLPMGGEGRTYLDSADLTMRFDAVSGTGWRTSGHLLGLRQDDMSSSRIEYLGTGNIRRDPAGNQVDGKVIYGVHDLKMADPAVEKALGNWLNGHVVFDWRQGGDGLRLPEIVVRGDGRRLDGALTVSGLSATMQITMRVIAQLSDLSRFSDLAGRPLSGSGQFAIDASLTPLSGAFDGEVKVDGQDLAIGIAEVDNLLKGTAHAGMSARRDETGTTLRSLDARSRSLQLSGRGKAASVGTDLSIDLSFSDLAALGAGYGGALEGKARVTGTLENGTLVLDGSGTDLAVNQPQANGLLRGQTRLGVTLVREGAVFRLDRARIDNPQLSANLAGRVEGESDPLLDLQAELQARDLSRIGHGYRGALAAKGSIRGKMSQAQLLAEATGDNLALGQAQADRLLAGKTSLSADLALVDGLIRVKDARLHNPQLSFDATGTAKNGAQQLELKAKLADLALLQPEMHGPLTLSGTAAESAEGNRLDVALKGPGGISGTVQGNVAPGYGSADLAIRGSAQAALANAFITPRAIHGPITYDLRLKGPLQLASLAGHVTLGDARIVDPALAFAIEGLRLRADLAAGQVRLASEARLSTEGGFSLNGTIGLQSPFNANLSAEVRRALLRDPALYEIRVNSQLTLKGPLTGGAMIAGRIDLGETELRIPSTGFGAIGAIPDLRHFNEPVNVRVTRKRAGIELGEAAAKSGSAGPAVAYGLDLRINAPNRIFVRGRGLDAELGGSLRLTGTTAHVIPSGAFGLTRGRLDILGKRLELSEATMRMEGDFIPDLAIAATSESDDIVASVRIDGPANDPDVSFTSDPELPQEEVLSRLLFNKGIENISALQAAQLANAVMNLAGGGAAAMVDKLRAGFGLDNLDVRMEGDSGASVAAGKYLSKNLYSEVGVDQRGETAINLNLDISRSVTAKARAGSDGDSGLGIFYQRDY